MPASRPYGRFFDDDVVVVDLQDADIVLAYEFLDVAAARDFIKGDLLLHDFVRGVDEDLEHVDLLLDLPRELLDPVGAGADDDREFMDARERRLGSRQAFDVDVAAREDRRDLAQQPDLVLRNTVMIYSCSIPRSVYSSRIADTGAPAGTIGNTFSSLSTRTSNR